MEYSEQMKIARKKLMLTQKEFAALLGVNYVTVCRWETGKFVPTLRVRRVFRELCAEKGFHFND